MINRLRCMLIKEFLQMLRDPRMRAIIFVAPVVQMMVIAFALTTDVTRIRTGLVDLDGTPASHEMVAAFTGSGHFNLVEQAFSSSSIKRMLDQGSVRVVIHLPAGFESDLRAGRTASLQLIVDGTDSNTAAIVSGYALPSSRRSTRRNSPAAHRFPAFRSKAVPGSTRILRAGTILCRA
jgi:hypothetical protein